ncbi:MAG: hypothetical protein KF893_00960 [Caldilineaceae bacterium]|nr:hypothetical protein [Caldilineaceae bacterium]
MMRRLELLFLPLLLDAVLWLAPRLGVEPLMARLVVFYREMGAGMGEAGSGLNSTTEQMAEMLSAVGPSFNLFEFMVNRTLYHVPSLLVTVPMLKNPHTSIQIESVSTAGILALGFGLLGILIGVLYMNLLALALPLGEGHKRVSVNRFFIQLLRHWLRTLLFVVGVFLLMMIIYIPATIGMTLLMLFSPALGSGAIVLMSGLSVVVFFYLYFVTIGLVLDDLPISQAVIRSVMLVRHNFWTTLGFILTTSLISMGMGLLLSQLAVSGPIGLIIAAPVNAFLGTGMVMALLVFYRTRILTLAGQPTVATGQQA